MKLYATIGMNGREALVVDKIKPLVYSKWGESLLIGTNNEGLYDVLYHEKFNCGPKAFGGHELKFPMADGTVLKSDGWWWAGNVQKAEEIMGIKLPGVAIKTVGGIVDCYCFTNYLIGAHALDVLLNGLRPDQRNWDYWSFEKACRTLKAQFVKDQAMHSMDQDPDELWKLVVERMEEAKHGYVHGH